MKNSVYVVNGMNDYVNWMQMPITKKLEDATLICFCGGEDVSPQMYNEPRHSTTRCNPFRDVYEEKIFNNALALKKHMIGICRGSQFLCVMNGGKLVQHQENKFYEHFLFTPDKKDISITSTHHQAQYPWNLKEGKDFKLLGWTKNLSKFHLDGNGKELCKTKEYEVENVYYPKTKCLGYQGHPEWMDLDHPTVKYLQNQLDLFIQDKL